MSTVSDFTFTLKLDGRGIVINDDASGTNPLAFSNASPATATFKGKKLTFTLYGVRFRRQLYEPGHIQAEILIQSFLGAGESINLEYLKALLYRRPVSLDIDGTCVASNYYIHAFTPQFEVSDACSYEMVMGVQGLQKTTVKGKSYVIYVKLDIFSLDKLLTLDPFCKAYLGKKLRADIIKDGLSDFPLGFQYEQAGVTQTPSITVELNEDLRMGTLCYYKQAEMIHPYLVQYNESFYDFVRRVANRCSEPLYFEDGKLCLGLKGNSDHTAFANADSVKNPRRVLYHRIAPGNLRTEDYHRDSVKTYASSPDNFNDEATEKRDDHFPKDAFFYPSTSPAQPYNSELAAHDHYLLLYKDMFARRTAENFSSRKSHLYFDKDPALAGLSVLTELLNSTSLYELLVDYAEQLIINGAWYGANKSKAQKDGLEVMYPYVIGEHSYATLFAKVDSTTSHWFTANYYSQIRRNQEDYEQKKIFVDMGEAFENRKLGELVTVDGAEDRSYVISQVDLCSGVAWKRSYDVDDPDAGSSDNRPSLTFQAIPLDSENKEFYPPALPGNPFRRASGPQPAFVTDADDPKRQGRVRIRFAWQPRKDIAESNLEAKKTAMDDAEKEMNKKKDSFEKYAENVSYYVSESGDVMVSGRRKNGASTSDYNKTSDEYKEACQKYDTAKRAYRELAFKYTDDSTPWIRMVTPMATDCGGGMYFRPEVGDEVMVDFENGNIDHPFVTGALFSKTATAPDRGKRVIVSRNGHTIRFVDPDDTGLFLGSALPAFGLLKTYGCANVAAFDIKNARPAVGGIELSDRCGLYRVTMSSHDRRISLASPFGDVKIDALTGISLSAPNGNIKIEGQNVEIIANNNLSLTSGQNIKNGGWVATKGVQIGTTLGNKLSEIYASFVDFSLLRTILEIFIRPVDGTLKIKSNRYLLLEAGDGQANIDIGQYELRSSRKSLIPAKQASTNFAQNARLDILDLGYNLSTVIPGILGNYTTAFIREINALKDCFRGAGFLPNGEAQYSVIHDTWYYKIGQNAQEYYCLQAYNDPTEMIKNLFKDIEPDDNKSDEKVLNEYLGRFNGKLAFKNTYPKDLDHLNKKELVRNKVRGLCRHILRIKRLINQYDTLLNEQAPINLDGQLKQDCTAILQSPYPMLPNLNRLANDPQVLFTWKEEVDKISTRNSNPDARLFCDNTHLANNYFDSWKVFIIRRITKKVLEYLKTHSNTYQDVKIDIEDYSNDQNIQDTNDPFLGNDWSNFINHVKVENRAAIHGPNNQTGPQAFGEGLASPYFKNLKHWGEWKVWGASAKGDIVFSNGGVNSFHFKSDTGMPEKEVGAVGDHIAAIQKKLRSDLNDI